jgi:hypothetical protein
VSDTFWIWLAVAAVIGIVRAIWNGLASHSSNVQAQGAQWVAQRQQIQDTCEARALELIVEFPELADDALALMMRDELMNRRMQHQEWYRWAVPDTVARMRRTLFLQVERERRKQTALK